MPDKPDRYYAAIRRHASEITKGPSFPDQKEKYPFGIKIELTVPQSNRTSHPVSVMKHLLDGVICAFHGEEEAGLTEQFQDKIINAGNSWNLLGPREYLRKHGSGVQ